jgi:hypothetical protein
MRTAAGFRSSAGGAAVGAAHCAALASTRPGRRRTR